MAIERTMQFSGKGRPGDLFDPNNWVGGLAPGIKDGAVIEMDVGGPVGGTLTANSMMLLGNETITFTGTLDLAGIPAPYGTPLVGEPGGCQGLMVCDGASAVFAPAEPSTTATFWSWATKRSARWWRKAAVPRIASSIP